MNYNFFNLVRNYQQEKPMPEEKSEICKKYLLFCFGDHCAYNAFMIEIDSIFATNKYHELQTVLEEEEYKVVEYLLQYLHTLQMYHDSYAYDNIISTSLYDKTEARFVSIVTKIRGMEWSYKFWRVLSKLENITLEMRNALKYR